jgi:hemolysin III
MERRGMRSALERRNDQISVGRQGGRVDKRSASTVFAAVFDALPHRGPHVVPLFLYPLMGWLCVFALKSVLAALPPEVFRWLLVGGVFYTSGIPFYALGRWYPACHGVWHLFVLAGSMSHFGAIVLLL